MPLVSQRIAEGQPTQLNVRISGVPEPDVMWLKDNHPIRTGQRINAEQDSDLYSLKISEVDIEDEGQYTCQASNTAGIATSEADLVVECMYIEYCSLSQYFKNQTRFWWTKACL